MSKTTTVKEFVDKFTMLNNIESKKAMIEKIVTKAYLPFAEKVFVSKNIVRCTYYKTDEITNETVLNINTPNSYLLFNMEIVNNYTDLQLDRNKFSTEYDLLKESGVLDAIIATIPEMEIKELRMVVDMVSKDVLQNEYETHAYINKQLGRFSTILGVTLEPALNQLGEIVEDETKAKRFMDKLSSVFRK